MKISAKSQHAVTALIEIATQSTDSPVTIQHLSQKLEISQSYLEQLFRSLRASDVIEGVRGPGGGYVLTRHASDISIAEIIEATEGTDMHADKHYPARTQANPGMLWNSLSEQLHGFLDKIKLGDFVKGGGVSRSRLKADETMKRMNFILPRPLAH